MAALYHAVSDAQSTGTWLASWSATLNDPSIGKIALRTGMKVIGESLLGNGGPQQIARRQMKETLAGLQPLGLGAFAAPGRSEEDDPHR